MGVVVAAVRGVLTKAGIHHGVDDVRAFYGLDADGRNYFEALDDDPPAVARRLREQWAQQHPEEPQDEKPAPVLADLPREWWEERL